MAIKDLTILGTGVKSKTVKATAHDLLNCYYDIQAGGGDKCNAMIYGTPGLDFVTGVNGKPARGVWWFEAVNLLFIVEGGYLFKVNSSGVKTTAASLVGLNPTDISTFASMADNGTQLCIVTGAFGYIYNPATLAFTEITASLPTEGCSSVTFLDGYFIVNRNTTGEFFRSGIYDGLTWNALDYDTAEANPDDLVAVHAFSGYLLCLGTLTIETWSNTGDNIRPFVRVQGLTMNGGLANIKTLSSANGVPTGLFRNRQGMFSICQINGTVQPISTPDIDYIINNYTVPTDATGFGYTLAGRAFYQITFNQEEKTWLYDFQSGMWSRLKSHDITRHIADRGVAFNAAYYVTHYLTGDLLKLNIDNFTDDNSIIEREVTLNHVFSSTQNMVKITKLRLDCETGNNASIALKISRDGGFTWGMPMITSMGNIGEFTKRAEWRKLGIARDWVLNLRMTDSVRFALINLTMLAGELNS